MSIEPTKKAPEIDDLISKWMGKDRAQTIQRNMCMTCDRRADEFKDELSLKEYRISGMCQVCQDEVFDV